MVIVFLIALISGCAYHGIKQETGREIDEGKVSQIQRNVTTSSDVLLWFRAPTTTTKLGDDEIFVYKFCKSSGGSFVFSGLGSTKTKEMCNELSIVFDKISGKVKDYSYQKQLED